MQKWWRFIANLLALSAMLGACFGAVIFIQDAPQRMIEEKTKQLERVDELLDKKIDTEINSLEARNAIRRQARDNQIAALDTRLGVRFEEIMKSLERIEASQYRDRQRAQTKNTGLTAVDDGG